uniref:Uncharacterized protein n=1 Tax=Amorphochlora amoebiformis TaxID=1561963 RepID=A0A7S0H141_9EUKA|mmetsp:Transcript_23078/g.36259  ORF Transcript_23078/g.36259 Transcript_23078/m.36259 type:complete len:514 (+) Transcript_23078:75-1616(+)
MSKATQGSIYGLKWEAQSDTKQYRASIASSACLGAAAHILSSKKVSKAHADAIMQKASRIHPGKSHIDPAGVLKSSPELKETLAVIETVVAEAGPKGVSELVSRLPMGLDEMKKCAIIFNLDFAVCVWCVTRSNSTNPRGYYVFDPQPRVALTSFLLPDTSRSLRQSSAPGFIAFPARTWLERYLARAFPRISLGDPTQDKAFNSLKLTFFSPTPGPSPTWQLDQTEKSPNKSVTPQTAVTATPLGSEAVETKATDLKPSGPTASEATKDLGAASTAELKAQIARLEEANLALSKQIHAERLAKNALRRYVYRIERTHNLRPNLRLDKVEPNIQSSKDTRRNPNDASHRHSALQNLDKAHKNPAISPESNCDLNISRSNSSATSINRPRFRDSFDPLPVEPNRIGYMEGELDDAGKVVQVEVVPVTESILDVRVDFDNDMKADQEERGVREKGIRDSLTVRVIPKVDATSEFDVDAKARPVKDKGGGRVRATRVRPVEGTQADVISAADHENS